jgi:hypothetical protein
MRKMKLVLLVALLFLGVSVHGQQFSEQILGMVRFDGSHINTENPNPSIVQQGRPLLLQYQHIYAIRFVESQDSVRAMLVNHTGQRVSYFSFECFLEGADLFITRDLHITLTNDRNTLRVQTSTGNISTFSFRAHPPVTGKTYRSLNNSRDYITFSGSNYQTSISAFSRGANQTYTYSEGIISMKTNDVLINNPYIIGPFLISTNSVFIEE